MAPLLSFTVEHSKNLTYNAALKMFKVFYSTAVDSSDHEDGMDYLSESFSSEVNWLFSGETTNCKKLSIKGLGIC